MSLLSDIRDLKRMVVNLVKLARVTNVGADDLEFPIVQIGMLGQVRDAAVWTPYGMHVNPPQETLCVTLAMQAKGEGTTIFPGSPRDRPKESEAGEIFWYHPETQSSICFRNSGDVEVTTDTVLTVTTPSATFSGDMQIDGDLNVDGNTDIGGNAEVTGSTTLGAAVTSSGVNISNDHKHPAGTYMDSVPLPVTGSSGNPT